MEYLIGIFIVIFLLVFINIFEKTKQSETQHLLNSVGKCPPHKWSWKDQLGGGQFISCDVCKMIPGTATYKARNPNDNE